MFDQSGCKDPTDNGRIEIFGSLQVTHSADSSVRIDMQIRTLTFGGEPQPIGSSSSATISGPYSQSGHMGQVPGTLTYSLGADTGSGTWNLFEIEWKATGITGRFSGVEPGDTCVFNGRFGGVRR